MCFFKTNRAWIRERLWCLPPGNWHLQNKNTAEIIFLSSPHNFRTVLVWLADRLAGCLDELRFSVLNRANDIGQVHWSVSLKNSKVWGCQDSGYWVDSGPGRTQRAYWSRSCSNWTFFAAFRSVAACALFWIETTIWRNGGFAHKKLCCCGLNMCVAALEDNSESWQSLGAVFQADWAFLVCRQIIVCLNKHCQFVLAERCSFTVLPVIIEAKLKENAQTQFGLFLLCPCVGWVEFPRKDNFWRVSAGWKRVKHKGRSTNAEK